MHRSYDRDCGCVDGGLWSRTSGIVWCRHRAPGVGVGDRTHRVRRGVERNHRVRRTRCLGNAVGSTYSRDRVDRVETIDGRGRAVHSTARASRDDEGRGGRRWA